MHLQNLYAYLYVHKYTSHTQKSLIHVRTAYHCTILGLSILHKYVPVYTEASTVITLQRPKPLRPHTRIHQTHTTYMHHTHSLYVFIIWNIMDMLMCSYTATYIHTLVFPFLHNYYSCLVFTQHKTEPL